MSQPKRYNLAWTAKALDPEHGAWVEWTDYAALAADYVEVKDLHLKARVDLWNLSKENQRLKSENERLRQAASEVGRIAISGASVDIKHEAITRLLAAMEGGAK